jgi:ABC-type phosphate/phosphonate transport system substrate-binding protein
VIADARMYAVAPAAAAAWRRLFERALAEAGLDWPVIDHAPPAPIDALWDRPDLGCGFMCGLPFSLRRPQPTAIAAPIPSASGLPVYHTDFVVRADAPFRNLEDTFGHRLAWTTALSQSGFAAPRWHLMRHRTPERPRLYRATLGSLHTPRRAVEAVMAGKADVGPLDSFCHALMRRHAPDLVAGLRVVASTEPAPIPLLVGAPDLDPAIVSRLRAALVSTPAALLRPLLLQGFAIPDAADYAILAERDGIARSAGYPEPA